MPQFLYRCTTEGSVNNGLKSACTFEMLFEEGPSYNCPLCGHELVRVSTGPSVSEILRQGQRQVDQQKKGTKK